MRRRRRVWPRCSTASASRDQKVLDPHRRREAERASLSGRNLPTVHVLPYTDVSTYHILWSDVVLIEGAAIGQTLEPIADTEPRRA